MFLNIDIWRKDGVIYNNTLFQIEHVFLILKPSRDMKFVKIVKNSYWEIPQTFYLRLLLDWLFSIGVGMFLLLLLLLGCGWRIPMCSAIAWIFFWLLNIMAACACACPRTNAACAINAWTTWKQKNTHIFLSFVFTGFLYARIKIGSDRWGIVSFHDGFYIV